MPVSTATEKVEIRPMQDVDLDAADRVLRLAFGTFLGLPDPTTFMGDADYVRSRYAANSAGAFVAELDGEVVGSNFTTRWGSVGFFGPLTVHPRLWDGGIGALLVEAAMDRFESWGVTQTGLFTFPASTKHVGLYRRFGFWPRSLTAVMRKPVDPAGAVRAMKLSNLGAAGRSVTIEAVAELAESVHPGLDLRREIDTTARLGLGDTVILGDTGWITGFAVCQYGAGSEAGSGSCYVKFGTVRPGPHAGAEFEKLLLACEATAVEAGAQWLDAGTSYSRPDAMARMNAAGFRAVLNGVSMHRPDEPGYHRADAYVIDDWR
jgi:predicted N-acetyltransferase YhbS